MAHQIRGTKRKHESPQSEDYHPTSLETDDETPTRKRRTSNHARPATSVTPAKSNSKPTNKKKKSPKKRSKPKKPPLTEEVYEAEEILDESESQYLIAWIGADENGNPYEPSWEPKDCPNELLLEHWYEKKRAIENSKTEDSNATETNHNEPEQKDELAKPTLKISLKLNQCQSRVVQDSSSPPPEPRGSGPPSEPLTFQTEPIAPQADEDKFGDSKQHSADSHENKNGYANTGASAPTEDVHAESEDSSYQSRQSPKVAVPEIEHPSQYEYIGSSQIPPTQKTATMAESSAESATTPFTPEAPVDEHVDVSQDSQTHSSSNHVIPDSQTNPDVIESHQDNEPGSHETEHEPETSPPASQQQENQQPSEHLDPQTPEVYATAIERNADTESEDESLARQAGTAAQRPKSPRPDNDSSDDDSQTSFSIEKSRVYNTPALQMQNGNAPSPPEDTSRSRQNAAKAELELAASSRVSSARPSEAPPSPFQTQLPYYSSAGQAAANTATVSEPGNVDSVDFAFRRDSTVSEGQASGGMGEQVITSGRALETLHSSTRPPIARSSSASQAERSVSSPVLISRSPGGTERYSRWGVISNGQLTQIGKARSADSRTSIANLLNPEPTSPTSAGTISSIPEEREDQNAKHVNVNGTSPNERRKVQNSDGTRVAETHAPLSATGKIDWDNEKIPSFAEGMDSSARRRDAKENSSPVSETPSSILAAPSQVPQGGVDSALPPRPTTPSNVTASPQHSTPRSAVSIRDKIRELNAPWFQEQERRIQQLKGVVPDDPNPSQDSLIFQNLSSDQPMRSLNLPLSTQNLPVLDPQTVPLVDEQGPPISLPPQDQLSPLPPAHIDSSREFVASEERNMIMDVPGDEDILPSAEEYFLPLSTTPQIRKTYRDMFASNANLVNSFAEARKTSDISSLLPEITRFVEKLYDLTSHIDLLNPESLSQREMNQSEVLASWDTSLNSKFEFLKSLFQFIESSNVHVLLLVKAGSLIEIVETFLRGIRIPYSRPGKEEGSMHSQDGVHVTLVSTGATSSGIVLRRADLVIGFDETFDFHTEQVQQARKHIAKPNALCPAVALIVVNSAHHIQRHLSSRTLSDVKNLQSLVYRASKSRYDVGSLPDTFPIPSPVPHNLGKLVGKRLLTESEGVWTLPSFDDCMTAPSSSSSEADSQSGEESIAHGDGVGQKRRMEQEDNERQTKTPRLTPNVKSSTSLTRVSDSVGKPMNSSNIPGQESEGLLQRLTESEARVAAVTAELETLRVHSSGLEKAMGELQTRFEEQSKSLMKLQSEMHLANSNIAAAEQRKEVLSNQNAELKTDRVKLREELTEARKALADSKVPELVELEELRQKAAQVDSLQKKAASAQQDMSFIREQYQQASAKAAEHASSIESLESENTKLKAQADGEMVKLRGMYQDTSLSKAQSEVMKLRQENSDMKTMVARLAEENRMMQEREEKRAGMAMSTRASSIPPHQKSDLLRPGTPGQAASRGPSSLSRNAPLSASGTGSRTGSRAGSRQGTPAAEAGRVGKRN